MPQFSYPGIYNEERRRIAPIQGVSTSNFGVVGAAERGPEDEATLVTSFTQFQETFGDFITDSTLAMQVYAFFAQEGRQAYVVRVCRPDAVTACGFVQNNVQDEEVDADIAAATLYCRSASSGLALPNAADIINTPIEAPAPLTAGTVSFRWWQQTILAGGITHYTAAAAPETRVRFQIQDALGNPIRPIERPLALLLGAFTWLDSGAVARTVDMLATAPANDIVALRESVAPFATVGYIDCQTGIVTIDMNLFTVPTDIGAGNAITNPNPFNYGTQRTVTDLGGALVGDVDPAQPRWIDYDGTGLAGVAGAFTFHFGVGGVAVPVMAGSQVLVNYTQQDFGFCAKSKGAWGNDLEIRVYGNEEFYTASTGQFSRVDIEVWYDDPIEGVLTLKETFTELVLDDPTNANYIVSVINDEFKGSDLIVMTATAAQDTFTAGVNGRLRKGYNNVWGEAIAGGNGTLTVFEGANAAQASSPIIPRTLTIRYYNAANALFTITDDGEGNLIGAVNPAGTNTVDYATGALEFTTSAIPTAPIPAGLPTQDGFLRAQFYTTASCGVFCTDAPTGGTDGVLPITRLQVSSPALEATNRGVYALNVPDEMMTVAIPDFASDPTVTLDLIAWAQRKMDKFIVASVPQGATPTQAKDYKKFTLASYSSFCALYYPYVGIIDPKTDLQVFMAPCGWVAGAYARTDNNKTVSKAPAGVEDGALNLVVSLERNLSLEEIGVLNKVGVNCLYESAETGRVLWGARTLSRDDFLYIQRRRFFMFVEKSVYKSTWGFVFETINTGLYDRIKNLVEGFLSGLLSLGYFPTGIPSLAYRVICDSSNNTPAIAEQGLVICDVYLAPTTPGEFILFRYQQLTAVAA
jgi:phage tail sheath protein FI